MWHTKILSRAVDALAWQRPTALVNANPMLSRLNGLSRYAQFLEQIVQRYRTAADATHAANEQLGALMRPSTSGPVTPEMQAALTALAETSMAVHLEIESFYLFAKIL